MIERIADCVKCGKSDREADIPPGSKGEPGVAELVEAALAGRIAAPRILDGGLMGGMSDVGRRFAANEIFIPEVLVAARAMKAGFAVLKPAFAEEGPPQRGVFIVGTVRGDLHDIGKNLLGIILEGAGWKIEDLGVDCPSERFLDALDRHPGAVVGLSALLTTTMLNMGDAVKAVHERHPQTTVIVGGAPVTAAFAEQIGAGGYADDPSGAVELLDRLHPPEH
ncbi:MAG: cobalamin-binding protein [bacterium]|nr:cobalamin-binding protein [bacterium]